MVKAARVPGALYAAIQPMRAAAARRSPLAYGSLAHEIPDEVTEAWTRPFLENGDVRRDTTAFLRAMDKATMLDAAARLPSLKIPSVVVWGQDDRFFPSELGRRLAAALPDARLVPIEESRTFVAEDAPETLAQLIGEFVGGGVPERAASPQMP
jgi:pimeloyl-ACP methyl ester carboxylesterase